MFCFSEESDRKSGFKNIFLDINLSSSLLCRSYFSKPVIQAEILFWYNSVLF